MTMEGIFGKEISLAERFHDESLIKLRVLSMV